MLYENDKISVVVETIIVIGRHCICFPLSVKLSTGFNPCRYRSGGKRIGHPTPVAHAISEIGAHRTVPQSLIFIGQVYV